MSSSPGTVIVTGAAGGLGSAIAQHILSLPTPYTVLFTVRNTQADNVKPLHNLVSAHKDSFRFSTPSLDLSSLAKVREFAKSVNGQVASGNLPPIRALILNAGFQKADGQAFTQEGLEMNITVNHLANFLLVNLLLQSMDKASGRIVFVSSWTHDVDDPYNSQFRPKNPMWQDPKALIKPPPDDPELDKWTAGMRRYANSKLAFQTFGFALQKKLDADPSLRNVCVVSVDPGAMLLTLLTRTYTWTFWAVITITGYVMAPFLYLFSPNGRFRLASKSARDVCKAAFAEDNPVLGQKPKGIYMYGSARAEGGREARDEKNQRIVWEQSADIVGLKKDESLLA